MAGEESKRGSDGQIAGLLRALAAAPSVQIGPTALLEFGGTRRFRAIRRLGSGGFGVVWLVNDLSVGAEVALKTLPAGRPELVYRLKREFRALADLRHENLVSFFELFADEEQCFFTMEYVPGETFLQYVRREGGADDVRLRAALAQLVRGLSALHQAGKLHRDLKPSNVLVTALGRLVLLDFGLATEIEEGGVGRSTEVAGTPEYMAPEQLRGEPLSEASDWYEVGIMLFEALSGRRPFGGTHAQLLHDQPHAHPPSLADVRPPVSPDLAELTRALLHRDPGQRPSASEISAALGLRRAGERARTFPHGEPPLIGREDELDVLRKARRGLRGGWGATVLVEGTSGVGKTSLVQHFLAQERGEGALVLRGRCFERERVPYQGIDSLVDDLCRHLQRMDPAAVDALLPRHLQALVQLFPVLERVPSVALQCGRGPPGSPDHHELRRQAFGALRELLARAADRQPLIVHIDDLQWSDRDTGALLGEVIRPPDAPVMLLVLSYRSEDRERSPCLQALRAGPIGEILRLEVSPLAALAAERLALALLGSERQGIDVARVAAEAGGNPFFIQELARFALLHAADARKPGPLDLQAALRERLDRLPASARALLEVVAVAGHPITEGVAHRATGLSGLPWDSWAALRNGYLVRFTPGGEERRVEPLHDRIREAAISALSPQRAMDCHRGLANALGEAGGADPEVLARHHEAVGRLDRARELAAIAGEQADRALAFDRAARLYRWALQLSPPDDAGRARLLELAAGALANAGRGVDAARAYLEAADLAEPPDRSSLRQKAAQQLLLSGRIDEGRVLAAEELRAAGLSIPETPRLALASLLLHRAFIRLRGLGFHERPESEVPPRRLALLDQLWGVNRGLSMVDVVRGADAVARYLLLALGSGEIRRVAQGLSLEAGHAASARPFSRRTAQLFERLERLDERLQDPLLHGRTLLSKGVRAYCSGDWRAALSMCDESERIFREGCSGVTWEIWTMRAFATWSLFQLGEWEQVERRVHVHVAEARERGNAYAMTVARVPFGLVAWLARGDFEGARAAVRDAIASWSVRGFHLQHSMFLQAESLLDLYAGDGASAWARICERWPALARSLVLRISVTRYRMFHMRTGCALAAAALARPGSEKRRLLREVAWALDRLERTGVISSRPMADLHRAALAVQEGRVDDAARRLESAMAGFESLHMRAYVAAVRRRLARLRGVPPPADFLPGQQVADPDAVTAMLAPGFPLTA